MKAILVYNLNNEADQDDYNHHTNGQKYFAIIDNLRDFLRQDARYGNGEHVEVYEKLFELAADEGIDIL